MKEIRGKIKDTKINIKINIKINKGGKPSYWK